MKDIKNKNKKETDFKKVLIKKALGYDSTEVVEEYVSSEEGEIKLSKKKITKKNIPPDLTALKMLIDEGTKDISSMTDEELKNERKKLLTEFANATKGEEIDKKQ